MLVAALLLLVPFTGGVPRDRSDEDVRVWLDRLGAKTAGDRSRAQRWLSRHLTAADLDLVRAATTSGDEEVRRRLAVALSDDDAHVDLAVELASSGDPLPSAVGRSALLDMVARWSPAWTRPGVPRESVIGELARKFDQPLVLDPRWKDARIDLALDQLARFAPGAPVLVLDPDLALSDHPREPTGDLEGTFERVLDDLVRVHRADLEGFAFDGGEDGPARRWIRVGRAVSAKGTSAAEHVAGWCLSLRSTGDPSRGSACAKAIAATGWPGGIAWLERRWRIRGDDAALDGVLLAAGRGLVSPSLASPEAQRELYGQMRALVHGESGDLSRASAIARAIAAVGSRGPHGEDLAEIAVLDLAALSPREQWLHLVVLEGARPSSATAATAVDGLLAAEKTPPPLAFQALRARAATAPRREGGPPIHGAAAILAWAHGEGHGEECVRLLVELRVAPRSPEEDPAKESARPASLRLDELDWTFHAGELSSVARALLTLSAPVERGGVGLEELSSRTRAWVRRGARERFEAAVDLARSIDGTASARLDPLQILSGAGNGELRSRWLREASAGPATRERLLGLAELTLGPEGSDASETLARALSGPLGQDDVIAALDRAIDTLRAARDEPAERMLVRAVRREARDAVPDLRARLRVDAWPPPKPAEVLRSRDLDRTLEGSGL